MSAAPSTATDQLQKPGKSTLTGATGDPAVAPVVVPLHPPPPEFASMDNELIDLLYRSPRYFGQPAGFCFEPATFWDRMKTVSVKNLQTLVQVMTGARKLGLWSCIGSLTDTYTYSSSWGIEFISSGNLRAVATNGQWGRDVQSFVRKEHGGAALEWYRQNSGAGNPGMHLGIDIGVGHNNLHWDPTNPMESIATGIPTFSPIPPYLPNSLPLPRGQAIYSPIALVEHAAEIGYFGDKYKKAPASTGAHQPEPFLSITKMRDEIGFRAKVFSDAEDGRRSQQRNKARALGATARLRAAIVEVEKLNSAARPIALEDHDRDQSKVAELAAKLEATKQLVWAAFAGFFQHLHGELTTYPPELSGLDTAGEWSIDTNFNAAYDKMIGLQKERETWDEHNAAGLARIQP